MRANSSAGEHLPYKQGVGGSNPSSPTIFKGLFKLRTRLNLSLKSPLTSRKNKVKTCAALYEIKHAREENPEGKEN